MGQKFAEEVFDLRKRFRIELTENEHNLIEIQIREYCERVKTLSLVYYGNFRPPSFPIRMWREVEITGDAGPCILAAEWIKSDFQGEEIPA